MMIFFSPLNFCPLSEPPTFVEKLLNMTCTLGEEVTLTATVKGSQPMTASWIQDKDHVLRDGDIQKITFQNNQVPLKVFKADSLAVGKYTCQLRNDAGVVECFSNITVLGLYISILSLIPFSPLIRFVYSPVIAFFIIQFL